MNVWFSDPCLYGAVLSGHRGYRSSSETKRKLLSGTSPGKSTTGQHINYPLYYTTTRGRLSIGYLPSEIQGALSRGEELLGKPPQGATPLTQGGSSHYKPSSPSLQPQQGGVIIETVAPEDPEHNEGEIEEVDFENQENQAAASTRGQRQRNRS